MMGKRLPLHPLVRIFPLCSVPLLSNHLISIDLFCILSTSDDPDMLEDLNEWRLDMEDDGESDGEFSMDQDQDFTDLERGNIERMRIPLDAEVDGGTDDDDGSGSDSDNEGNMEVELDWQLTFFIDSFF